MAVDGVGVGSGSGVDCRRGGCTRELKSSCPSVVPQRGGGGLTGRALEVEDLSVVHEHVDLVYGTYALNVELLESGLELLVIGGTGLLGSDLPPDRSLGTACVRAECECRLPLSFEIGVVPLCAALCCPRPGEPGEVR